MTRRHAALFLCLAVAGCASGSAPAAHQTAAHAEAAAAPPASSHAFTASEPTGDVTASGPASGGATLTADLPDDGRVLFDGDLARAGLGSASVSGSFADNSSKWRALRSELGRPRVIRAAYTAPPAPSGDFGLRAGAQAPAVGAGRAFDAGEYQRFQQSLYTTVYPVLSRLGWRAHPRRGSPEEMSPYRITVHHTEGHQTGGAAETAREVRNIQEFHMGPERGWDDIGYHFLIDGDGRIAEGRPTNVLGAHAQGANDGNIGISLMGDFDVQQPTAAQLDSLERLSSYLAMKYDIDVTQGDRFEGHYHHDPTSCPGRNVIARLAMLRARIGQEVASLRRGGAGASATALASFTPLVVTHRA